MRIGRWSNLKQLKSQHRELLKQESDHADNPHILISDAESRVPDVMFQFPQVIQLIIPYGVVTPRHVPTEVTVSDVVR